MKTTTDDRELVSHNLPTIFQEATKPRGKNVSDVLLAMVNKQEPALGSVTAIVRLALNSIVNSMSPVKEAEEISIVGDLIKCQFEELSFRVFELQKLGYSISMEGFCTFFVFHNQKTLVLADEDMRRVGFKPSVYTLVNGLVKEEHRTYWVRNPT